MRLTEFASRPQPNLIDALKDFLPIAIKHLGLKSLPKMRLQKDVDSHHEQPTFGKYDNAEKTLYVDVEERHPMDVIRTIAHELTHFKQDTNGELSHDSWETGSPAENEANAKAGVMMREFSKSFPQYLELGAIQVQDDLDEGWKDWVAGGAMAAAALGAQAGHHKPTVWTEKPDGSVVAQKHVKHQQPAVPKLQAKQQVKPQVKTPAPVAQATKPQPANEPGEYTVLSFNPTNEVTLQKVAIRSGLKGAELAQFLAQMKHESWNFDRMKEKAQGKGYFEKRYGVQHAPKTAKILGNKHVGDGERFKGRGYIQLTGRSNYQMASDALGLDLVNNPDLAAKPEIAAKIAVWYWKTRVSPNVRNFADTSAVTKAINPAMRGLEDRHANFLTYNKIL